MQRRGRLGGGGGSRCHDPGRGGRRGRAVLALLVLARTRGAATLALAAVGGDLGIGGGGSGNVVVAVAPVTGAASYGGGSDAASTASGGGRDGGGSDTAAAAASGGGASGGDGGGVGGGGVVLGTSSAGAGGGAEAPGRLRNRSRVVLGPCLGPCLSKMSSSWSSASLGRRENWGSKQLRAHQEEEKYHPDC